jgi:hypothetical protein
MSVSMVVLLRGVLIQPLTFVLLSLDGVWQPPNKSGCSVRQLSAWKFQDTISCVMNRQLDRKRWEFFLRYLTFSASRQHMIGRDSNYP